MSTKNSIVLKFYFFFQTNHRHGVDMTTDTDGRDSTADDAR